MDDENVVVGGFEKSATESVVGELREWNGRTFAYLGVLRVTADGDGWVPGVGVAIEATRIMALIQGVRRLRDVASIRKVVARIPVNTHALEIGVQPIRSNQHAYVRRVHRSLHGGWLATNMSVDLRTEYIEDLIALAEELAWAAGVDPGPS